MEFTFNCIFHRGLKNLSPLKRLKAFFIAIHIHFSKIKVLLSPKKSSYSFFSYHIPTLLLLPFSHPPTPFIQNNYSPINQSIPILFYFKFQIILKDLNFHSTSIKTGHIQVHIGHNLTHNMHFFAEWGFVKGNRARRRSGRWLGWIFGWLPFLFFGGGC